MDRKYIGFFSENHLSMADNGSIHNYLSKHINYDKEKVLQYLKSGTKEAICPKIVFDILSGKQISASFTVYTDGEYIWKDDLAYYVRNYDIILPDEFIKKAST